MANNTNPRLPDLDFEKLNVEAPPKSGKLH